MVDPCAVRAIGTVTPTGGSNITIVIPASTTVAAGSNGATLPQAIINVASTSGYPSAGTITVVSTNGAQYIQYTGTTATSFTGCNTNPCASGTGTLATGNAVTAGTLFPGVYIVASNLPAGSIITSQTSGTTGLSGVYVINNTATAAAGVNFTAIQYNTFSSTSSGWYLITYKFDIRINSGITADNCRGAAALMLDNLQVPGSGTAAQAPDNNHQYSISNTVLVQYAAGQKLGLQWWAGYYSGTTLQTSVAGLSIGPDASAGETPWVPAAFNPVGIEPSATSTVGSIILPQNNFIINVSDTTGYPTFGTITVMSDAGLQSIQYTGKTGTSFTGCNGGTGTIADDTIVKLNGSATFKEASASMVITRIVSY